MKIHTLYLLLAGVFLTGAACAQTPGKQVTHQQLAWFSYNNTLKFSDRWSLTSEVHERRFINPGRHHHFLVRTQGRYVLGQNWEAAVGFTYSLQSPHDPRATENLVEPELRPHLQFDYRQPPIGRLSIRHRYRAEKRFFRNTANGELAPGYTSNSRFRYRLTLEYMLTELNSQPLKLVVYDEVHVNAGRNIVFNRFDQNRIFGGLNYSLTDNLDIDVGYLNWYQQRSSGYEFYNRHILQLAINHKIDLSKKSDTGSH